MKYFVTGATGFIGGRLAEVLKERGHEVVAIVRNPARASHLAGITLVQGDITDKESMREAMTGVDGVYHVAGWYKLGVLGDHPGQAINVDGTRNVLELMRELDIPKGVYTSTVGVFSDTHGEMKDESFKFTGAFVNEYERTKWEAHYRVAQPMIDAGLPLVIVQPGAVYGPGDNSVLHDQVVQYLQRRLPAIPAGMKLCWAHVDDIVEGHILAMEKGTPGESYIIAGPPHTLVEFFEMAERITGIPAPRIVLPPAMVKAAAAVTGLIENVIPLPMMFRSEVLRSSAGVTYLGDNSKAKHELGYDPRPLEQGLRETLPHDLEQISAKIATP